jgi:imidazolonepropionase
MTVLTNIGQLATCPPDRPQADAGIIRDAAVAIREGIIEWCGPALDLPEAYQDDGFRDCEQKLVVPGLVDCHTHLAFGGWRGDEFEMRLCGASYQEIAAAGGGIASTVAETRKAGIDELEEKSRTALDGMLSLGVTTVEAKSGYGLTEADEIKQLETYRRLNQSHAVDLVPTFLGAHIIPPEFKDKREEYIDLVCNTLIPRVAEEGLADFCDAFVEQGAYRVDEARRIFRSAKDAGLGIKLHADQLSDGGGGSLAAEFGAVSAEHLEYVSDKGISDMAAGGTVAVSLPLASLYLGEKYIAARQFIDTGVPVAVATDFNPGSAPSWHLPLAMTLACINQGMTPQEALTGATTVAARAISRQERIGSILPGYQADLAVIDTPNLNHWLYHFTPNACIAVMKKGVWVNSNQ